MQHLQRLSVAEVLSQSHELNSHGVSLDRQSDPGLHSRYVCLPGYSDYFDRSPGAIPPYIYSDIGGLDRYVWFVLAYLLALAAVCPFVGSISDLMGRRYVALMGGVLLVVAMIVCSTAQVMNTFIAGMAIAGIGAGICELTALAGTAELAPVRNRGKYVAVLIFTVLPFVPSVLWAQLIAAKAGWRYCGALCMSLQNLIPREVGAETSNRWSMGCSRAFRNTILLLPTSSRAPQRVDEEADLSGN